MADLHWTTVGLISWLHCASRAALRPIRMSIEHIVYLYPSLCSGERLAVFPSPLPVCALPTLLLARPLEAPFCLHFALSQRAFIPPTDRRGERRGEDMHSWMEEGRREEGGSAAD